MIGAGAPLARAPLASLAIGDRVLISRVKLARLLMDDPLFLVEIEATGPEGATETLRFSDGCWIGEPDDPHQANVAYWGRVLLPLRYERTAPLLPEDPRRLQVSFGSVELGNLDGALDESFKSLDPRGRRVRVLRGRQRSLVAGRLRMSPYDSFDLLLSCLASDWEGDEERLRLELRDDGLRLAEPAQRRFYGGSGGEEGTADMKDRAMPLAFGRILNLAPDLVDPARLIYRVHSRAIEKIDAVRDRGFSLANAQTDHPDFASLSAADVAPGTFHECRAQGLFRIGHLPPEGFITCDLRGDAEGGYVETHSAVARRLLRDFGGLGDGDLIVSSLAEWPDGPMGLYDSGDGRVSLAELLDRIAASVAGWWGQARDGRLRLGRLSAPRGVPDLELTPREIAGRIQRLPLGASRRRQAVTYAALVTTQDRFAGGVPDADQAYYRTAFRLASAELPAALEQVTQSGEAEPLPSFFTEREDAETLAGFLLELHGQERRLYRVPVTQIGRLLELGSEVRLSHPRLGLQAPRDMRIIAIREDRDAVELTLWG